MRERQPRFGTTARAMAFALALVAAAVALPQETWAGPADRVAPVRPIRTEPTLAPMGTPIVPRLLSSPGLAVRYEALPQAPETRAPKAAKAIGSDGASVARSWSAFAVREREAQSYGRNSRAASLRNRRIASKSP